MIPSKFFEAFYFGKQRDKNLQTKISNYQTSTTERAIYLFDLPFTLTLINGEKSRIPLFAFTIQTVFTIQIQFEC